MRRHASATITEALRDMDPAPSAGLTRAEADRAEAGFARIVATSSTEPGHERDARPRRRRSRLLVALGLAGAAGLAAPALLLGGGSAYASWTPTPAPLTDALAATAATTCRTALDAPDRGERVAVAERRGGWVYVLLSGPDAQAACLMPEDLVGKDPSDRRGFFGNYDMEAAAAPALSPDRIDEATSMQGSTDEGWFLWVEGYVGSDVTGVTVHTSSGLDVEASVSGDRYAAWWPSTPQDSEHPDETWSYTVHLSDGSNRRTG